MPSEFDDYIAQPKGNDYRSLHTAVIGPEDKALEVQIRTHEMHQHSELGVAAHWRYKEGEGRRAIPRSTTRSPGCGRCWTGRTRSRTPRSGCRQFKSSLFDDTVYVLTPQGQVVDLPHGATPVDFA